MEEYGMWPNIREHSMVVSCVAEQLWENLATKIPENSLPPKKLIIAGGLLHDIAKTICLKENCDHAQVGAQICEDHGFSDLAEIVREHVLLNSFKKEEYQQGIFQAKELIYYADKRVMHDRVVSLQKRLEYILHRYGGDNPLRHEVINNNFRKCQELEDYLCHYAGCQAEDLLLGLHLAPYTRG